MKLNRLLLLVLLAVPASARILSYAPYTDRISRSTHHERTTRWFLLSEEFSGRYELVLYDSAGAHEPRVVDSGWWRAPESALYERKNAPDAPPMLLVGEKLSVDGGLTWKTLAGLYHYRPFEPWDFDTGGPFVQGLATGILPGTDDTPFIVAGDGHSEVYAVHANGELTLLHDHAGLVGRNATGDQFLINSDGEILIVDLAGRTTPVVDLRWGDYYSGWLTKDGSVYLQAPLRDGRYLSFYRNGSREFVAGPIGGWPEYEGDDSQFPEMTSWRVTIFHRKMNKDFSKC